MRVLITGITGPVGSFLADYLLTLPDIECSNCTLQVIQFMYDDPAAPYYFQCADLVIAAGGEAQDAGAAAPTNQGPMRVDRFG